MNCGICFEPIKLFYYKDKCKCNVRYHYECVIKWYKYKKKCIYCNKYNNYDINLLQYKYNKLLTTSLMLLYLLILFIIYLYYCLS